MYIINKKLRRKCFIRYSRTCCFCIRNLIRLTLEVSYVYNLSVNTVAFYMKYSAFLFSTANERRLADLVRSSVIKRSVIKIQLGEFGLPVVFWVRLISLRSERVRTRRNEFGRKRLLRRLPFDILLLLLDLLREGACYMEQFITWESAEYNPAF